MVYKQQDDIGDVIVAEPNRSASWQTNKIVLIAMCCLSGTIAIGFAHFAPGLPGLNSWLYVGFAAIFGILAGDLTARTGSLGAAWGWHFANNSFAVLIVSTEGSVSGLGLWRTEGGLTEPIELTPWLLIDIAIVLGIWIVLRRVLRV